MTYSASIIGAKKTKAPTQRMGTTPTSKVEISGRGGAGMDIGAASLAIRNLSLDPARTEKWGAEDRVFALRHV